jgi:hypothetical protein
VWRTILLLPVRRDRDPAHRDIETAGFEILGQLRPCGLDILHLDPERLAQRLRHIDVKAAKFLRRPVEITEGQIVAGHADPQAAALDDVVEAGSLLSLRSAGGEQQCGGEGGENSDHA